MDGIPGAICILALAVLWAADSIGSQLKRIADKLEGDHE